MTIVKQNYIEKLYSEKVAEYIMKGYVISIEHTHGSQTNEVSTICLTNDSGKSILRVGLIRACEDWRKEELKLVILKYENVKPRDVLWISKGEVLFLRTFIEVDREKKVYCESEEDFDKILSLRRERSKNREYEWFDREEEITSEKIKDLVWKIARKYEGYKSVQRNKITKITKDKNGYFVSFENRPRLRVRYR